MTELQRSTILEKFGIVSLSSIKDNILMWSHYSNCHQGFCIGFDTQLLKNELNCAINPIQYLPAGEYPVFSFDDFAKKDIRITIKLTHIKSDNWRYESEYRLIGRGCARESRKILKRIIKEIILGCMMATPYKLKIIDFVRNEMPHVNLYDSKMNNNHFRIDLIPIQNFPIKIPIEFYQ